MQTHWQYSPSTCCMACTVFWKENVNHHYETIHADFFATRPQGSQGRIGKIINSKVIEVQLGKKISNQMFVRMLSQGQHRGTAPSLSVPWVLERHWKDLSGSAMV